MFGVSMAWEIWGKPEARKGLRTRGSQRPLDSQEVSAAYMEHRGGAFKASSLKMAIAVQK
ncbi:hypothetical protein BwSH20_20180 [Bradyrhizobium ottawaense]|nr:hypothetical protein BwSF12_17870 [Bradyrhizobium ottawaense]GMO38658.1 hypothetical protein BwSH14_47640 [Bradyrhizobium ottawaense]GMO71276.1 hypothetical protein BwSG20_36570 [Bradyrhizobium ottawaense]GMO97867.1 hypothetical protein BwSH20_20180 [Bradyrhizobium ottawaense]